MIRSRIQRLESALQREHFGGYIVVLPLPEGGVSVNGEILTDAEWQERMAQNPTPISSYDVVIPSARDSANT